MFCFPHAFYNAIQLSFLTLYKKDCNFPPVSSTLFHFLLTLTPESLLRWFRYSLRWDRFLSLMLTSSNTPSPTMYDQIKPELLKSSIICQLPKSAKLFPYFQEFLFYFIFFISVLYCSYQTWISQGSTREIKPMWKIYWETYKKKQKKTKNKNKTGFFLCQPNS